MAEELCGCVGHGHSLEGAHDWTAVWLDCSKMLFRVSTKLDTATQKKEQWNIVLELSALG